MESATKEAKVSGQDSNARACGGLQSVPATTHVYFDEKQSTFRLYAGSSLYCFSITRNLNLEHLYFGPVVSHKYDMRFLSDNVRREMLEGKVSDSMERYHIELSNGHLKSPATEVDTIDIANNRNSCLIPELSALKNYVKQRGFLWSDNYPRRVHNYRRRKETFDRNILQDSPIVSESDDSSDEIEKYDYSKALQDMLRVPLQESSSSSSDTDERSDTIDASAPKNVRNLSKETKKRSLVETKSNQCNDHMSESKVESARAPHVPRARGPVPPNILSSLKGIPNLTNTYDSVFYESDDLFADFKKGNEDQLLNIFGSGGSSQKHDSEMEFESSTFQGDSKEDDVEYDNLPSNLSQYSFNMDTPFEDTGYVQTSERPSDSRKPHSVKGSKRMRNKTTVSLAKDSKYGSRFNGVDLQEYGTVGFAEFNSISTSIEGAYDGKIICPLKYKYHRIYNGRLPMPDALPGVKIKDESEASTLEVVIGDPENTLEVHLIYVCMHNHDVITRRAVFKNIDFGDDKTNDQVSQADIRSLESCLHHLSFDDFLLKKMLVTKASSLTLDFEYQAEPWHFTYLSASLGNELTQKTVELVPGLQSFGSTLGMTMHRNNPFAAISKGSPAETTGEIKGVSLFYSGSFLCEAEVSETGRLRLNMGISSFSNAWHLHPGEVFNTPEAVIVRSNEGLGGLSRAFHRLIRENVIRKTWTSIENPIIMFSKSAQYTHMNESELMDSAQAIRKLGVNTVIFEESNAYDTKEITISPMNDYAQLEGLSMITTAVKVFHKVGLKLGVSLHLEEVAIARNMDESFRNLWLVAPESPKLLPLTQRIFDLTNHDIVECVFEMLADIINCTKIEYLKLHIRLPLTEIRSNHKRKFSSFPVELKYPVLRASTAETLHLFVLGVYKLLGMITSEFPQLSIELCSNTTCCLDPAMLCYAERVRATEETSTSSLLKTQYGASLVYPIETISTRVLLEPSEPSGDITRIRTRGLIAMLGSFGYDIDLTQILLNMKGCYTEHIKLYKVLCKLISHGDLYRLWNPFNMTYCALQFVDKAKKEAVIFVFTLKPELWYQITPHLSLRGLLHHGEYVITEPLPISIIHKSQSVDRSTMIRTTGPVHQLSASKFNLSGEFMMSVGIPIKFFARNDAILLHLRLCKSGKKCSES